MVPRKNGPRKNGPWKIGPWKNGPRKIGPWKNGPRKYVLQKLFSVNGMLGNLNDFFIFINWFHYTHKDVWRLRHDPAYAPNCRTLKESRKICFRVLGFHRLITSQHSTHTPRCWTPTPRFFVSEFPEEHFSRDHFSGDHFSGDQFSGDHFSGDQFSGDHFTGDHFSRGLFFRGPFFRDSLRTFILHDNNIKKLLTNWYKKCLINNKVTSYFLF